MTQQVIYSGTDDDNSASATEYNSIASGGVSWTATETDRHQIVSTAGTFSNLRVEVFTVPGAGKSLAFTVMKNGSPTALTTTIADSAFDNADTTNTVSFVAGDTISLRCVPSGTPAVDNNFWSVVFDGTTTAESLILGSSVGITLSNTVSDYLTPNGGCAPDVEANVKQVVSTSGTINNLYIRLGTAPDTGNSYTFILYKNGSPTALTVVLSDFGVGDHDSAHPISVVAGDIISIISTPTSTPISSIVAYGMTFLADTNGESLILGGTDDAASATSTTYISPSGAGSSSNWNTTLANEEVYGQGSVLKNLYIDLGIAPGSGNSYTYAIIKNGTATDLAVTISDTATSGNNTTNTVSMIYNDFISLRATPVSIPSSGDVRWGITSVKGIFSQTFTENLALTDTYSEVLAANRTYTETLNLIDNELSGIRRTLSEIISLNDGDIYSPEKVLIESLSLLDNYFYDWVLNRTYSEIINLIDLNIFSLTRNLPGIITLADSFNFDIAKEIVMTEIISLTDSKTKRVTSLHQEIFSLVDSLIFNLNRNLSEINRLTDSRNSNFTKSFSEILSLLDSYMRTFNSTPDLSEILNLTDGDIYKIGLVLEEILNLIDSIILLRFILLSETILFSDNKVKQTSKVIPAVLSLVDTQTKILNRELRDNINLIDSKILLTSKALPETLNLIDNYNFNVSLVRIYTEILDLSDLDIVKSYIALKNETINLLDTPSKSILRNLTENILLVESIIKSKVLGRGESVGVWFSETYSENLSLSDVYSDIYIFLREYLEMLNLSEQYTKIWVREVSENINLIDTFSYTWALIKLLNETIDFLDILRNLTELDEGKIIFSVNEIKPILVSAESCDYLDYRFRG